MNALFKALAILACLLSPTALAGAGGEMRPAPVYETEINYMSLAQAEQRLGKPGVLFYDVNVLEIWADGYIPGAIHFFVDNWKDLLPEDKDAEMIFYCANRLCNASEIAAHAVKAMGYTNVSQMPDGIFGWKMSGRVIEKP
ncbi:Rhodanese domain protein [Ferrimonas balearica DSM 9799]|uniref:Rhodanese domain protein n=1 Tax=Ferrimonas balearica (strain DSM 9799 / CCM 4581 / KCTC 23876 / PAT) TaxID=550540 RepID=E1SQT1_FERBD|nr:rhodanese-like domain-containing protein [Ferrimonas balearica]ADN75879.1 Rhodanese domain protein [Ferrimonas balearica DSM 9799]MBY5979564.1 rhodanese-like domain-containing protein [Ferrimonas balearica]MBY6016348.1 rhodanese-like domain-containing protein [Halomonas denitrificans]MBY6095382.1 rhodanese-like domain-containing protein [Ferrimonas balearica]